MSVINKYLAVAVAYLAVVLLCIEAASLANPDRLLKQYPMILSHDAATSMLDVKLNVVSAYTQTQAQGSLSSQLDCGSRAFDYRPYLKKDNTVIAHHGTIKVDSLMKDSVQDIINWLAQPQNVDELVVLYVSHCEADGDSSSQESRCVDASADILQEMNVSTIRGDCSPLATLTVGDALAQGKLPNAGSLLAIYDCANENFVQAVNCWGVHNKREYSCYGKNKEVAWDALAGYLNSTASPLATAADNLWLLQAHWQSNTVSVPLGDLHRSSVLKDESKAGVNAWLAEQLKNRALPYETLSFVELDNVCDGGLAVLEALREAW